MKAFLVIRKSNVLRRVLVVFFLLPFWFLLLYLMAYSKQFPEVKSFLSITLYILLLVFVILLSDNLHKIISRKYKLKFSETSILISSKKEEEILYSSIQKIVFFIQRYDNKIWIDIYLNSSEIISYQIIDKWYKTPFLTIETKRNFQFVLSEISSNQNLQQIVDNSSVENVKEILNLID